MLSKAIETCSTNTPTFTKVKLKVKFTQKVLRTVILSFYFLLLLGLTEVKPYLSIQPKRTVTATKDKRVDFVILRELSVFAFIDFWVTELAITNLLDQLIKVYTVSGCFLQHKKLLRPHDVGSLVYLDPGLEYFIQKPSKSELFLSVTTPDVSWEAAQLDLTSLAARSQFFCQAFSV